MRIAMWIVSRLEAEQGAAILPRPGGLMSSWEVEGVRHQAAMPAGAAPRRRDFRRRRARPPQRATLRRIPPPQVAVLRLVRQIGIKVTPREVVLVVRQGMLV